MLVLHLIDASGPQASPTTLALLADALDRRGDIDQKVLFLGGAALRAAAAAVGLEGPGVLAQGVPAGHALAGYFAAARPLREGLEGRRPDLVHCWSIGALLLAAIRFRSIPRILTVTAAPAPAALRLLRAVAASTPGKTAFLPISATLRRTLLWAGIGESAAPVLRPSIDLGRVHPSTRAALRQSWGLENEGPRVLALLGDPPTAPDASTAAMVIHLAAGSQSPLPVLPPLPSEGEGWGEGLALPPPPKQPRLCLLLHPNQRDRRRTEQTFRRLGNRGSVILDERLACPWEVLPGCDLALALGPHAGGLSLLWAMAANVPIVGEATHAISEAVEDRHSALLAKPDQPRLLAHRVTQLLGDPQLAWRLRDTARHEAFSFFSRQRYRQSLHAVYRQLGEGRDPAVPAAEMTGGLRFAGPG